MKLAWLIVGVALLLQTSNQLSSTVGTVVAVDKTTKTISIKTDQNATVAIKANETTVCLRVPLGAQSLDNATLILFDDITTGDRVLARGTKAHDTFAALRIVVLSKDDVAKQRESFKTIGATLTVIDLEKGEISATTLDQKKPIQIATVKESSVRRIPATMVLAIAQKARANSQSEVQQMIETLPVLPLSDLKVGDVLSITGIRDKDDTRITAIKMVAGVDAVLKAMAPQPGRPQTVRPAPGYQAHSTSASFPKRKSHEHGFTRKKTDFSFCDFSSRYSILCRRTA